MTKQKLDEEKKQFIPFSIDKLDNKEGKIYGIDIGSLEEKELQRLQMGNYSDKIYRVEYQNANGEIKETEARLYFTISADRETVRMNFLPKLEKPDVKEWLNGGYRLQDTERERLLKGETLAFTNKPIIMQDGVKVRSDNMYNYLAKIDDKTNQVVIRNMDSKLTFKFHNKLYGVDLTDEQVKTLKIGSPIVIENPTFGGKVNQGKFEVKFDVLANNNVVKRLQEKQKVSQTNTQEQEVKNANKQSLQTEKDTPKTKLSNKKPNRPKL